MTSLHPDDYIGRFAPSPSGPLHMGSLVCAIASYLDAKAHHGKWLLRIEDIDPPREQKGSVSSIRQSLQDHGLYWDGDTLYQSQHSERYQNYLKKLKTLGLSYYCACNRQRLRQLEGRYDGHCQNQRQKPAIPAALRLNTEQSLQILQQSPNIGFNDRFCGDITENIYESGDFIIHRKDDLFAYQLAVVADDIDQHITHIVRGDDLLEMTNKQILLTQLFGHTAKHYAHIPVVKDLNGKKLSKQNNAPAIQSAQAIANLREALKHLHIQNSPDNVSIDRLLIWATERWHDLHLSIIDEPYKGEKSEN